MKFSSSTGLPESSNGDKAGRGYWDQFYNPEYAPRALNPSDHSLRNFVESRFHEFFMKTFSSMRGKNLLEVGCGGSRFLPYFSKQFGLNVSGMDYSAAGCAAASKLLDSEGVSGQIICADIFNPPVELWRRFDVAVSFGVVEHFAETAKCISAIARLVKPEGLVLTFVPNLVGSVGYLQKVLDRRVFEKHKPLDRNLLEQAHLDAGLIISTCDYFLFSNFGVNNINEVNRRSVEWFIKNFLLKSLRYISGAIWAVETTFHQLPPNRFTSPYIVCAAKAGTPSKYVTANEINSEKATVTLPI
jgi:2-polyprenyl-3-methyl-5-hydroxy-6-metoxy-1,4-benzoquinol methylase